MLEFHSPPEGAHDTDNVEEITRLREVAQDPTIARAVEAVREFLGMDVAYATEMTAREQIFRSLEGDGASFGVGEGTRMPVEQTYCGHVLNGRLPNLIPDVAADERAAAMPVTEAAGVGAFVSVPLRLSDGSLYGTLCAAGHEAKPSLGYRDLQFLHVFARMIADQFERELLQARAHDLDRQLTAISALLSAIGARDAYTAAHSREVVALAGAAAEELGIAADLAERTVNVALLHDIGKLSIPDSILRKPGPLDDREWEEMRLHPVYGERIVSELPELSHLAPAVRAEHERWDGTGYPDGIAGESIPIESRIVLCCDAFHAMVSDRPYRAAMIRADAIAELQANSGSQFDPWVVRALLAVLERDLGEYPGSKEAALNP